jgi:hypothetical protein
VDAGCTGNVPPGVGNRIVMTAIHLTLSTTHAAPGLTRVHMHPHVYDPSKKIQPSIHRSSLALFLGV